MNFIKLAKDKDFLSSLPKQVRPNKVIRDRTREMVSTIGHIDKKDKTPLWQSAVRRVATDVDRYKKTHGNLERYIPSKLDKLKKDLKDPVEVKKGLLTTGAGLVARNNPKFKPIIDGITRGKVEFKKTHDTGTSTSMQYTLPKGKGDYGKLDFTWRF